MFEEIAPFVRAVGFEADAEECERLNRAAEESPYRSLTFLPFALGSGESRGDRKSVV